MNNTLTKYCYNAFVGRLILTRAQNISLAVGFAVLAPVITICNAAVIIALHKTKQSKSEANWNVILLCISDCFLGSVSIPLYIVLFGVFGNERICWYEMLTMFVGQINIHFSAYMMMIIAIQRYIKARPKLSQSIIAEKMLSKNGFKVLALSNLLLSTLHGLVSTYFFGYSSNKAPNILMMVINILNVLAVYISYIKLYRGVKIHVADTGILNQPGTSQANTPSTNQPSYYHELIKTMTFILASFAICSFPYLVADFATGWYSFVKKQNAPQTIRYIYYLTFWPITLNCIINAVILLYRNKKAANYIRSYLGSLSTARTSVIDISNRANEGTTN